MPKIGWQSDLHGKMNINIYIYHNKLYHTCKSPKNCATCFFFEILNLRRKQGCKPKLQLITTIYIFFKSKKNIKFMQYMLWKTSADSTNFLKPVKSAQIN